MHPKILAENLPNPLDVPCRDRSRASWTPPPRTAWIHIIRFAGAAFTCQAFATMTGLDLTKHSFSLTLSNRNRDARPPNTHGCIIINSQLQLIRTHDRCRHTYIDHHICRRHRLDTFSDTPRACVPNHQYAPYASLIISHTESMTSANSTVVPADYPTSAHRFCCQTPSASLFPIWFLQYQQRICRQRHIAGWHMLFWAFVQSTEFWPALVAFMFRTTLALKDAIATCNRRFRRMQSNLTSTVSRFQSGRASQCSKLTMSEHCATRSEAVEHQFHRAD